MTKLAFNQLLMKSEADSFIDTLGHIVHNVPHNNQLFLFLTSNLNLSVVLPLQTHHVYFTLNQRRSRRFHVVSTWNTLDVFVGSEAQPRSPQTAKVESLQTISNRFQPLIIVLKLSIFDACGDPGCTSAILLQQST